MSERKDNAMNCSAKELAHYEPPRLTSLGSVADLTLTCDKKLGQTDGFTFVGQAITCSSV
jgi:hypothetical protein